MKINDVPQDDAGFLKEGKVRDVCYAVDESGNYTQVLSLGWDPKNEAMRHAWSRIHEKAELVRQEVISGKYSPIAFHMERTQMNPGLLAQYTGFSRLRVRRDMKPRRFENLSEEDLKTYAEAFNLSVEDLINI